jgi:hypothetical protein
MKSDQQLYDELAYYTLSLGDATFIHQHIVDAFCAQHADKDTKAIAITFALAGLYLYLEKNYTGRQVQLAHVRMAKRRKKWPVFDLPEKRGDITVVDALNASPGVERQAMIRKWCESVWAAYNPSHQEVAYLVQKVLFQ